MLYEPRIPKQWPLVRLAVAFTTITLRLLAALQPLNVRRCTLRATSSLPLGPLNPQSVLLPLPRASPF